MLSSMTDVIVSDEVVERIVNGDVDLTLAVASRVLREHSADFTTEIADWTAGLPVERDEVGMVVLESVVRRT